jgi:hypothetical protein
MQTRLKLLFAGILLAMLWVTIRASLNRSVVTAAVELWNDPWGMATIFDAYFGFLTFFAWVWYKEASGFARGVWFLLIMGLGNIAMAVYVLRELARLKPGEPIERLLLRHTP